MILTTVRSQPLKEIRFPDLVQPDKKWRRDNLGFLTDEHRVNVAITRARQGLIIVGEYTTPLYYSLILCNPLQVTVLYWSTMMIRGSHLSISTNLKILNATLLKEASFLAA